MQIRTTDNRWRSCLPAAALMLVVVLCCACKQQRQRAARVTAPDSAALASPGQLAGPDAQLRRLAREVLKRCSVTRYGSARGCRNDVLTRLAAREQQVGPRVALASYCHALGPPAPGRSSSPLRVLAASRLDRLGRAATMATLKGDAALLRCLMETLRRDPEQAAGPAVARAAAYLAGAMGRQRELIQQLDSDAPAPVREAGYGALWANGRLHVLDTLRKVLGPGGGASLKLAVVRGFGEGTPWTVPEQRQLCGLLAPLMRVEQTLLAGAAAERVASGCGRAHTGEVIVAAELMLKRGVLDLSYVNAVGALDRRRLAADQLRRVTTLHTRVVTGAYPALVRSASLRNLFAVNPEAGRELARRHRMDNSQFVASTARRILLN